VVHVVLVVQWYVWAKRFKMRMEHENNTRNSFILRSFHEAVMLVMLKSKTHIDETLFLTGTHSGLTIFLHFHLLKTSPIKIFTGFAM
jgi:hypothetical protein